MRLSRRDGIDVERWGLRMRLYPRDNGCEKGALFTPQMYEAAERTALASAIDATSAPFVFVDIGANVGLFSLYVASRVGPDATILAIEPEPENLPRLRFNVAANPGVPVRILPIALGDMAGEVAIEANHRDRGGARTRPGNGIECLPLLDLVRRERLSHIDALKIDVEGAEDKILAPFFRDAPMSLWPGLIIIEDNSEAWAVGLFSVLSAHGYLVSAKTKQNVMLKASYSNCRA